jgi:hypothetical protein
VYYLKDGAAWTGVLDWTLTFILLILKQGLELGNCKIIGFDGNDGTVGSAITKIKSIDGISGIGGTGGSAVSKYRRFDGDDGTGNSGLVRLQYR